MDTLLMVNCEACNNTHMHHLGTISNKYILGEAAWPILQRYTTQPCTCGQCKWRASIRFPLVHATPEDVLVASSAVSLHTPLLVVA